jgi:biotin-dependent carboxylase-like uncharacterized protein
MSARPDVTPTLTVLAPGTFTTLQDEGRPGLAAWGVGRSGAADRSAAALANRLVANPPAAAVFEMTMGGLAVLVDAAVTVALTGAPAPAELDGSAVAFAAPVPMPAGSMLRVGTPTSGLRTYLAVRGGLAVAPVLGSRSYDVLAALGPPPVQAGDILALGRAPKAWPHVDSAPPARPLARITVLAGSLGPHVEALEPDARGLLTERTWTVSWDSDRSGLRLDGAELSRVPDIEWPPEGVVRGALQVPPSGRPVLMLADHPVTGGYPAVGALDDASCDLAAQLRPGDRLRLALR